MALVQKTKSLCNVPIFVHALIVIKDGPLVARPDKEVVAHTRVVKVVDPQVLSCGSAGFDAADINKYRQI